MEIHFKPFAAEGRPAQLELPAGSGFRNDMTKTSFHQRAKRHSFTLGKLAGLAQHSRSEISMVVFMAERIAASVWAPVL